MHAKVGFPKKQCHRVSPSRVIADRHYYSPHSRADQFPDTGRVRYDYCAATGNCFLRRIGYNVFFGGMKHDLCISKFVQHLTMWDESKELNLSSQRLITCQFLKPRALGTITNHSKRGVWKKTAHGGKRMQSVVDSLLRDQPCYGHYPVPHLARRYASDAGYIDTISDNRDPFRRDAKPIDFW